MTSLRTAERLSRLLSMVPWVVANPGSTTAELQERFGYETKGALLKDLNLIFVCGLPGYGPGDLIDVTIDDDEVYVDLAEYFSRPVRLTAAEALMLLAAGSAVLSSGTAPPALDSAVTKLRSVVTPDNGVLDVDLAPEPEMITVLREAVSAKRILQITYTSLGSGKTTERNVEPWAVFATMGNWYLTGHCRLAGSSRVFRVDRIRDAVPSDERFEPPPEPEVPHVAYTPSPDDVTAKIRLSRAAAWVADYFPVRTLKAYGDGSFDIEFSSSDPLIPARLLLRLGSDAELLDGDEVAEAAKHLRARILARYGQEGGSPADGG